MATVVNIGSVSDCHQRSVAATVPSYSKQLHSNCVISALVFLILIHSYTGTVDALEYPAVAGLLMMVLGAPHGALDAAIALRRRHLVTKSHFAVFLLQYVGLAGLIAVLWWLMPGIALAAFLLMSAYHFGGDWPSESRHVSRAILGLAILSATTVLHVRQVELIFGWLAPAAYAALIAGTMSALAPIVLGAAVWVMGRYFADKVDVGTEFIVVLTAAILLPPITFFVTYFCMLHSVRHLFEVREELPQFSAQQLIQAGWRYAVIAVIGSLLGALAFQQIDLGPALLSSVFVTLSALTVPHIVLMDCVASTRGKAECSE